MNDVKPILTVEHLSVHFTTEENSLTVIDDVSFAIKPRETFCLVGESGCGKSLTALSIMQLLPPTASINADSKILLGDHNLLAYSEASMRKIRGQRIGMIFQEPMTSLNPVLTIGEQIGEVVRGHFGLRRFAEKRRVLELLNAVGIPDPKNRYKEYPHQLSGGMKQRVMIAIAIAGNPDLLIADEPTTALDVTIQSQVLSLLKDLQTKFGMAILLITHDLGIVSEMADTVAVMYAGQIVEQAPKPQFFAAPKHPYSQKLFSAIPTKEKRDHSLAVIPGRVPDLNQVFHHCRFAKRCEFAWNTCHEIVPRWLDLAPQQGVRCHLWDTQYQHPLIEKSSIESTPAQAAHPNNETVLEVQNLQVYFPIHKGILKRKVGEVRAVDGINLTLKKGKTLALVGESGCGKTTAGRSILQLIRPSYGSVKLNNIELTTQSEHELKKIRSQLQIIFQDPYSSMNPRMMIGDIIEEGMNTLNIGNNKQERQQQIDDLLQIVGLPPDSKYRYPHEFSGGQRQRVCIARALAVKPSIIICDEPTSALDVSVQAQILNLLKQLQREMGLSFLFITHNISIVAYMADEVAVMYLGKIVEFGRVEDILYSPRHPYTQALLSAVPEIDAESKHNIIKLEGELPSPINPPEGCHFHPRCPKVMPRCKQRYPGTITLENQHQVNCFLVEEKII